MCETASERYEHALTIFESRIRQGIPIKLSSICRENRVYYRGMLKWLYKSGRNLSDIRKDIKAESKVESQSHKESTFVEMININGDDETIASSSHALRKVRITLWSHISLDIDEADAGSLAEFIIKLGKEAKICSD